MRRVALPTTFALLASLVTLTARAAPAAAELPGEKDPGHAIAISAAATVASGLLIATRSPASLLGAVGLVIGPSTGHWYAGGGNGKGLLLRSAGAVAFGLAALHSPTADFSCFDAAQCDRVQAQYDRDRKTYGALLIATGGVVVGSALYDTITAGRTARRWNRAHALTAIPLVSASSTSVVVAGRF